MLVGTHSRDRVDHGAQDTVVLEELRLVCRDGVGAELRRAAAQPVGADARRRAISRADQE